MRGNDVPVMYPEQLRRLLGRLKRVLRIERRPTQEESNRELEIANVILEHGRMLQSYLNSHLRGSVGDVMVEVPELAFRLRETPKTIEKALLRLKNMGLADRYDLQGCWKLKLTATIRRSDDNEGTAISA